MDTNNDNFEVNDVNNFDEQNDFSYDSISGLGESDYENYSAMK